MDNEKELWERLTAVEQSNKSAHHRLGDIQKLVESVQSIATEIKYMREDLTDVKSRVDVIESKPSKRWDLITTAIITAFISGGIGLFISNIIGGLL